MIRESLQYLENFSSSIWLANNEEVSETSITNVQAILNMKTWLICSKKYETWENRLFEPPQMLLFRTRANMT